MSLAFNLLNTTDSGGRRAQMHLPHQTVETPVFMPVGTAGTVKAVPQDMLESLGAQIISAIPIISIFAPATRSFADWAACIDSSAGRAPCLRIWRLSGIRLAHLRKVTDEGVRFRSHLDGSSHFFTPEHSMDVQIALGADICHGLR